MRVALTIETEESQSSNTRLRALICVDGDIGLLHSKITDIICDENRAER